MAEYKREGLITARNSYKFYRTKAVEKKVTVEVYTSVFSDFMKYFLDRVLQGEEMKLPERFGTLRVEGKKKEPILNEDGKITNMPVDWKSTKELWARNPEAKEKKKVVFFLNEHTNGIVNSLRWRKKGAIFPNKELYSISKAKGVRKQVSKKTMEGQAYAVNHYKKSYEEL